MSSSMSKRPQTKGRALTIIVCSSSLLASVDGFWATPAFPSSGTQGVAATGLLNCCGHGRRSDSKIGSRTIRVATKHHHHHERRRNRGAPVLLGSVRATLAVGRQTVSVGYYFLYWPYVQPTEYTSLFLHLILLLLLLLLSIFSLKVRITSGLISVRT